MSGTRSPRQFGAPEVELIELLAGQADLALETARLRTAQQDVIVELSGANEVLRQGREVLDWAERRHRELMQLLLDEFGLAGLVTSLTSTLDASVSVEDADGRFWPGYPTRGIAPRQTPRRGGANPPGGLWRRWSAVTTWCRSPS